ncbi:hypothetical protein [Nevskia ramosa]|uniref:hypothetical protein n=1 Tax=Nevskia ramosa TaxID=64002 RepID=UPI003D0E51AD
MKRADALKLQVNDWVAPRRDFKMTDGACETAFIANKPYRVIDRDQDSEGDVYFSFCSEIARFGRRTHGMDAGDLRTFDKVESPFKRKARQ